MPQKFIINNRTLIMGDVDHHRELAQNHRSTTGGGYWFVDNEAKIVYLYSKSLEFKQSKYVEVIDAVVRGRVPEEYKEFTFCYSHSDSLNDAKKLFQTEPSF